MIYGVLCKNLSCEKRDNEVGAGKWEGNRERWRNNISKTIRVQIVDDKGGGGERERERERER